MLGVQQQRERDLPDLTRAIEAWRVAVGPTQVLTDASALGSAQTATFRSTARVPAIVRPGSTGEVRACVRIANECQTPIYPISTGKNFGYGSRVPVGDACILDLGRMDRILDYDEMMAYVRVEPGVTFGALEAFLAEKRSRLCLSAPGGSPDASLIGNAAERGIGYGPGEARFDNLCGLEVVLPTGGLIQTGFERFAGAKTARLQRSGIGPAVDGLFCQSNLGIITKATFWLKPLPAESLYFSFGSKRADGLAALVDALEPMKLAAGDAMSLRLFNDYRIASHLGQYPWVKTQGRVPLSRALLHEVAKALGGNVWLGEGSIGADDEAGIEAVRASVERRLGGCTDELEFRHGYEGNPFLGASTDGGLTSAYWRKRDIPPADPDPDRDGCGLIWCSPVVPFVGAELAAAAALIETRLLEDGFEPGISLQPVTGRAVNVVTAIAYDRDVAGEDERASACHGRLLVELLALGYVPYRLGIQGLGKLPASRDDYGTFLRTLKQTLDPNDILAPGRYDHRSEQPGRVEPQT